MSWYNQDQSQIQQWFLIFFVATQILLSGVVVTHNRDVIMTKQFETYIFISYPAHFTAHDSTNIAAKLQEHAGTIGNICESEITCTAFPVISGRDMTYN